MVEKEFITKAIKPDENTTLAKLSLTDMIRLLFSKISNNDVAELDANEKLSASYLKNVASLSKFIDKATERIINGTEKSVTVQLSSEYLPFIDEVIDPVNGKGRYFNFEVYKKDLPQSVKHKFIVKISKK
jgi:hypothetical protein